MAFLSDLRARLAKATTTIDVPAETTAAVAAEGMNFGSPFSPGVPLTPHSGMGGEPRRWEFNTGYNITSRADRDKRVSFDVLKGLIDNYDIARMAIGHRIDDVRSLDWSLTPKRGFSGDIEAAAEAGYAALKYPEGPGSRLTFRAWQAKFLEDVLRYDAGCLFRRRNRAGKVIGLKVVSGRTIAPTLDYWGDTPAPPGPAYVQFVQGMPWKWFTSDDLIYQPFRPQPDSAYGFAPLEAVLLTANTDLRFQMYFLNSFTEGTIPEGFMSAPENASTPDQLEQLQAYWDALLYGDEAAKHQLKMVPFGTQFNFPDKKDFNADFPTYLMRKVAAAYHVTPNDLGFTDDVNRSTSESQVDVQFRVGTLPLVQYMQDIITSYLQDDLGLPLEMTYDVGQETDDRVSKAQAHQIYVNMGAESVDEVRSVELGLPVDNDRPVPRFVNNPRTGPVPLTSIFGIAGKIDPETAAPAEDVPLTLTPFNGAPALLADKTPGGAEFTRAPQDPDEPAFPALEQPVPGTGVVAPPTPPTPVAKEATAGVTADTGLVGVDLVGQDDEDDDPVAQAAELASFRRFTKARRKAGTWRDFTFTAHDDLTGHRLNQAGRAQVRKAAGDIVAAGLCVQATDTGRVLMLQRALDPTDPAAGSWEFPGGCLEQDEDAQAAAFREWCEETGLSLPAGELTGSWTAANGVYVGFVYTIASEDMLPILSGRDLFSNPDDLDGDLVEAIAWWTPADMVDNPVVRDELAADMLAVLGQLAGSGDDEGPVVKSDPRWESHPTRRVEAALAQAHAGPIQAAIAGSVTKEQLRAVVAAYVAAQPDA